MFAGAGAKHEKARVYRRLERRGSGMAGPRARAGRRPDFIASA